MEFNKSNCFSNENQKEENLPNIKDLLDMIPDIVMQEPKNPNLRHYKGKAGEFDYDCTIWEISCNHLRFRNRKVESLPKNLELPEGCIDMSDMFYNCENLTDISLLQNWNTSNVKDMSRMFDHCENLTDISPLQNWDTSEVKDMEGMFSHCKNLTDISPLKNWDTSKVADMRSMFKGCVNLTDISPLQNWDTLLVENTKGMFKGCTNITDETQLLKFKK